MLFSSADMIAASSVEPADSNTYQPFRTVDAVVTKGIAERLDAVDKTSEEGVHNYYSRCVRGSRKHSVMLSSSMCARWCSNQGSLPYVNYALAKDDH